MAPVIGLLWLFAMVSVFGWLLWWDRTEERDHRRRSLTRPTDLDVLAARAQNGDETCVRFLWETLIDDLANYRDIRWVLDHLQEGPGGVDETLYRCSSVPATGSRASA